MVNNLPQPASHSFEEERYIYSNVRVFAAFSVLLGHAAGPLLSSFTTFNKGEWWIGNLYVSFFRSGLPLFLFLTGALLLPKANDLTFVLKRFKRILIPALIWNLVYAFLSKDPEISGRVNDFSVLFSNNSYHLWFVYVMLLVYLFMPFLFMLAQSSYTKWVVIYTLFYLILLVVYVYYRPIFKSYTGLYYGIHAFVYGYYILIGFKLLKWAYNKSIVLGLSLFFGGFLLSLIGSYLVLDEQHAMHRLLHNSFNLHIFLKAIGAFILIKNITKLLPLNLNRIFDRLGNYCFGVYLIHPLVFNYSFLYKFGSEYHFSDHFFLVALNSIICFLLSLLIVFMFSKIPSGKYLY
ncbi:acyltransferase [Rufibacter sp. LB8]|uniref:acyltransferase n=1 Tax=Rufibacter sp. LB8 TaxID=2777781 RepID=UPI00178C6C12|nr:acyltransferase [Rufibacter sp. LB8]